MPRCTFFTHVQALPVWPTFFFLALPACGARRSPAGTTTKGHVRAPAKPRRARWLFFKGLRPARPSHAGRWKPTIQTVFRHFALRHHNWCVSMLPSCVFYRRSRSSVCGSRGATEQQQSRFIRFPLRQLRASDSSCVRVRDVSWYPIYHQKEQGRRNMASL